MRYLDAKKRLAIMMAAAKFLRLKMNENPSIKITTDEVKLAIIQTLQMVPESYAISVKDLAVLRNGIKALLFKIDARRVDIKDSMTLDTYHCSTISPNDHIIIEEFAKIHNVSINSLEANNLISIIQANNILNFALDCADQIIINSRSNSQTSMTLVENEIVTVKSATDIYLNSYVQTDILESNLIKAESLDKINEFIELNQSKPLPIISKSVSSLLNNVTLELEEIKSIIQTNSYINIKADNLLKTIEAIYLGTRSKNTFGNDLKMKQVSSMTLEATTSTKTTCKLIFDYLIILSLCLIETTPLKANFELQNKNATHVCLEEKIIAQFDNNLISNIAEHLGLVDNNFFKGTLALEFDQFVTIDFAITEIIKYGDLVELNKIRSIPSEIYAKLFVLADLKMSLTDAKNLSSDYNLTIADSVTLGKFKYAIIQDFDEKSISSIDELLLDEMIYITK